MSNDKLTSTSYVVLGSIAMLRRATSYDLKRLVGMSIGHFWTFPHSQLYAEPERLVRLGLLTEDRETGGRRRRVYSITEDGEKELEDWLRDPRTDPAEVRYPATLKLFFGNLVDGEAVVSLAKQQIEVSEGLLDEYRRIEDQFSEVTGLEYQMATLRCGIAVEVAVLDFWKEIAEKPPARP
ncbi:MAG: PadR family transcriptional regulator [Actinomycetota bacterium]